MSDTTDLLDQFLRKQGDILKAYQSGLNDIQKDRETLTRLLLIQGAGENTFFGGDCFNNAGSYSMINGISNWASGLSGVTSPVTVIVISLLNARKFRFIFQGFASTLQNNNSCYGYPPPTFFGCLSTSKNQLSPQNFFQIGKSGVSMAVGIDDNQDQAAALNAWCDSILACSGSDFIHLFGLGGAEFGNDYFGSNQNSQAFYQLIR